MENEYPKMLYRPGNEYRIWGYDVDTRIVSDADEEESAKREGWAETPLPLSPLDHDLSGEPGGSLPRKKLSPKPATEETADE